MEIAGRGREMMKSATRFQSVAGCAILRRGIPRIRAAVEQDLIQQHCGRIQSRRGPFCEGMIAENESAMMAGGARIRPTLD